MNFTYTIFSIFVRRKVRTRRRDEALVNPFINVAHVQRKEAKEKIKALGYGEL